MELIIILMLIALYFAGFKFIDNIYNLASPREKMQHSEKNDNNTNAARQKASEVLIFGSAVYCSELSNALNVYGIISESFKDLNELNMSNSYKFLIAAGNSDLDNLTICSIAAKMMEIDKIFAVCNQPYSRKLYEENNIQILNSCSDADCIARTVATFS